MASIIPSLHLGGSQTVRVNEHGDSHSLRRDDITHGSRSRFNNKLLKD